MCEKDMPGPIPGGGVPHQGGFRSNNFPDRYLRHAGNLLRIDPIGTATGRQDATFRITP